MLGFRLSSLGVYSRQQTSCADGLDNGPLNLVNTLKRNFCLVSTVVRSRAVKSQPADLLHHVGFRPSDALHKVFQLWYFALWYFDVPAFVCLL